MKAYVGNPDNMDREVISALAQNVGAPLTVLSSFRIPGTSVEVDLALVKQEVVNGESHTTIFAVEVKRESRRLWGGPNGDWKVERMWRQVPLALKGNGNPMLQAQKEADALRDWIDGKRHTIADTGQMWLAGPRVFPRLLLVNPHPQNDIQKDAFVHLWSGLREMVAGIEAWRDDGKKGVFLQPTEVERLASLLRLTEVKRL